MNSTTYSEFEEWLPRPAALKLGLALWIAGFAVAGAAALHKHRAAPLPETFSSQTSEASGVLVLPEDVVIGHRSSEGATLKQKP
jgi:hypothetical protein